ncbi:MAG: hypothetical protein SVE93_07340 [Candidatus Thermoplasmatota archaeon]|nr:hypothetical protein [Candidatus Thermoplasmatota archaeon]
MRNKRAGVTCGVSCERFVCCAVAREMKSSTKIMAYFMERAKLLIFI